MRSLSFLIAVAVAGVSHVAIAQSPAANSAGYRTVQATQYGRAIVGLRQDTTTVPAALQATLHDVGQYFGAATKVRGAYEDQKDHRSGGATFTATTKGMPIKGLITCKLTSKGASVAVVYIAANAPPAEWSKLMGPRAAAASGDAPPAPAAAHEKEAHETLHPYQFPDGSGSIGLADGWHTDSRSANGTVHLTGPDGAQVVMGNMFAVQTPNSPLLRLGNPLVAPFTSIPEALRILQPQINRLNQRNGGPSRVVDNVKQIETRKPNLAGGRAGVLTFGITEGQTHYKSISLIEMSPVTATSWMWTITQVRAPDAIWERVSPVMLQMTGALKPNAAVVSRQNQQMLQNQQDRFAAQQAAHRAQMAGYDAHNKQYWETQKANEQQRADYDQRENAKARGHDDFDETIRGYRTVEDTQTGVKRSVDLGNVDKIVDDLNERDPGRFRQIPLRDEMDPTH